MKYMGGKSRIAKYIMPIILKDRQEGQWFVDPFVGGGSILERAANPRIGGDLDGPVIAALKAIQDPSIEIPREISEEEYRHIRDNQDLYPLWLVGYVGYALSYGGKWFGGYRRDKTGKRNYADEAYRSAMKQRPLLEGAILVETSYELLDIPPKSIVYCDPPYRGTTGYKDGFDHDAFWTWAQDLTKDGHSVFVSEFNAPDGWVSVWAKERATSLTADTGARKSIEQLFVYAP